MDDDELAKKPQNTETPVFRSTDISGSKAAQKPNYFVRLRRGSVFDKLSQKIDQKKTAEEIEARKKAEQDALKKAEQERLKAQSPDRFRNKELEVKVPTILHDNFATPKASTEPQKSPKPAAINGPKPIKPPKVETAPSQPVKPIPAAPAPATPKPAPQPPVQPPKPAPQPTPAPVISQQTKQRERKKSPNTSQKFLYILAACLVFLIAAGLIIWKLIPETVLVTKPVRIPAPITEKTLLDEVTEKRLVILKTFKKDGDEAGLKAYSDYLGSTTDTRTLALIHAWRALDLYNLHRGQYKDQIFADIQAAESLTPTKSTATLLYFFEREFGDAAKAAEYLKLAKSRPDTKDDDIKPLVETLDKKEE